VIQIQRYQAGGELHVRQIKRQQVPRNVNRLRRFVAPEKHGTVAFQFVPRKVYASWVYVGQGSRNGPGKLVVGKKKAWARPLERPKGVRDGAREFVPVEAQGQQVGQLRKRVWYGAGEVIKGKVEKLEIGELGQKRGYWAGDVGPADSELLEFSELGDGGLDWAGEFRKLVESEGL